MRILLVGLAIAFGLSACVTRMSSEPRWQVSSSASGTGATLVSPGGEPLITFACASGAELRVTVPSFTPIGSEDRLSFGLSDDPVALVAELPGTPTAVTARGPIPSDFADRVRSATAVSASYGSQSIGPFAPPKDPQKELLAKACATLAVTPVGLRD